MGGGRAARMECNEMRRLGVGELGNDAKKRAALRQLTRCRAMRNKMHKRSKANVCKERINKIPRQTNNKQQTTAANNNNTTTQQQQRTKDISVPILTEIVPRRTRNKSIVVDAP